MKKISKSLKCILVGDSGVGKTCIFQKLFDNPYKNTNPTIGVEYRALNFSDEVKLHLWDTAGQERFRGIIANYFRSTNMVIIVFDLNNDVSIEHINYWKSAVFEYSPDATILLIGNKIDLMKNNYEKLLKIRQEINEKHPYPYLEFSALSSQKESLLNFFQESIDQMDVWKFQEPTINIKTEDNKRKNCC